MPDHFALCRTISPFLWLAPNAITIPYNRMKISLMQEVA